MEKYLVLVLMHLVHLELIQKKINQFHKKLILILKLKKYSQTHFLKLHFFILVKNKINKKIKFKFKLIKIKKFNYFIKF